jgi:hypothetical protein
VGRRGAPATGLGQLRTDLDAYRDQPGGFAPEPISTVCSPADRATLTVAKRARRKADWLDPTRVPRPCRGVGHLRHLLAKRCQVANRRMFHGRKQQLCRLCSRPCTGDVTPCAKGVSRAARCSTALR